MIDVPIVELIPEKQETARKKIASDEGICYRIMNSYVRSYYIYPIDTTAYNYNVTNGYKAKYIFIYWVDHGQGGGGGGGGREYLPRLHTGGVHAMFLGLKLHLKAIFLGLKFSNINVLFWGGKNFQQLPFFSQFNYVIPQKIVPCHQIYD